MEKIMSNYEILKNIKKRGFEKVTPALQEDYKITPKELKKGEVAYVKNAGYWPHSLIYVNDTTIIINHNCLGKKEDVYFFFKMPVVAVEYLDRFIQGGVLDFLQNEISNLTVRRLYGVAVESIFKHEKAYEYGSSAGGGGCWIISGPKTIKAKELTEKVNRVYQEGWTNHRKDREITEVFTPVKLFGRKFMTVESLWVNC